MRPALALVILTALPWSAAAQAPARLGVDAESAWVTADTTNAPDDDTTRARAALAHLDAQRGGAVCPEWTLEDAAFIAERVSATAVAYPFARGVLVHLGCSLTMKEFPGELWWVTARRGALRARRVRIPGQEQTVGTFTLHADGRAQATWWVAASCTMVARYRFDRRRGRLRPVSRCAAMCPQLRGRVRACPE